MGCDIHAVLETKVDGKWKLVGETSITEYPGEDPYVNMPCFYSGRSYALFAVLADVRNGYGFAGCNTGDRIEPIADPRGVPDDASDEYKTWVERWDCDGHSHSYHTLTDLLSYDWTREKVTRGYLDMETYAAWAGYFEEQGEAPKGWCGDVGGPQTQKITRDEAEKLLAPAESNIGWKRADFAKGKFDSVYIQCEWRQTIAKALGSSIWIDIIVPMLKIGNEIGADNVRMVFFFDN